jgi:hypothetical protein
MRSCCVALRLTDRQPARQRGIVIARLGDVPLTNREAEPWAAINDTGIDCPASDEGGCLCVILVLLPTI